MKTCRKGLHQYEPEKPNKRGCLECEKQWHHAHYETNKQNIIERTSAWKKANTEKDKEHRRIYYETKSDKIKETIRAWKKKNSGKVASQTRKRQAAKLQRTPKWITSQETEKINFLYTGMKVYNEYHRSIGSPLRAHVDHEVPLQGKTASGLHTLENLRVIPANQNLSKHNKC